MKNLLLHRKYRLEDYNHLEQKGYSDEEIVDIWNEDLKRDIVSNLLFLEVYAPDTAKEAIEEYQSLKVNNPHKSNPSP